MKTPPRCTRIAAASLCATLLLSAVPALAQPAPAPDAPQAHGRRSHVSPQFSATVNAREAERRLEQAQKKRSLGMAPQAGESVQTPGGNVVNARYWNRQERLRLEVELAQRRLNHVQRPQLAARQ